MRSANAPAISAGVMIANVHLEHHVDALGDGHHHRRRSRAHGEADVGALVEMRPDAGKHELAQIADPLVAVREGQRIAGDHPGEGHQRADGERLHQRGDDVLLAHHAGVEQAKARNGHQQHQRGAGHHPGGVASVDRRRLGVGGHRAAGHGQHRQGGQRGKRHAARCVACCPSSPLHRGILIIEGGVVQASGGIGATAPRCPTRRCGCARRARSAARRSCRHRSCRCWRP